MTDKSTKPAPAERPQSAADRLRAQGFHVPPADDEGFGLPLSRPPQKPDPASS
jgi:hypothetical protein